MKQSDNARLANEEIKKYKIYEPGNEATGETTGEATVGAVVAGVIAGAVDVEVAETLTGAIEMVVGAVEHLKDVDPEHPVLLLPAADVQEIGMLALHRRLIATCLVTEAGTQETEVAKGRQPSQFRQQDQSLVQSLGHLRQDAEHIAGLAHQ